MPWRVIAHGDQVWHVDALAERPANAGAWQLVLSFRSASERSGRSFWTLRSEEHTSELQSHSDLVCRLLLEKKKNSIAYDNEHVAAGIPGCNNDSGRLSMIH